ncbi:MAG: hypothetical protein KBD50_03375 [Candidatus Pacebacteria bacterium]|nr:hypothetical protein [Candidatus Paceibacterota bacterium]
MNRVLIIGIPIGVVAAVGLVWFLFFRAPGVEVVPVTTEPELQSDFTQTVNVDSPENTGDAIAATEPGEGEAVSISVDSKIYKIGNGPVAGATIIQTLRPTTTVARYVQQNNGHVFDITLDSSGAVPRSISNTTIPGIVRVLWAAGGNAALLQYLDAGVTKTVHLGFPVGQSTTTRPVTIKFLPDGIQDLAVSPSGASVVYLLKTATGVNGFIAKADGTESKQVFTIPLKEVLISWPSQGTLLAQSKSAFGVPGIAFSINATSGAVLPLLYASGLTLTANPSFARVVYQTNGTTYSREVATGKSLELSFDPYPEKCIWGTATTTYLYCATPLDYTDAAYLNTWHQGINPTSDAILLFDVATDQETILAVPGSEEGGVDSAIHSMSISEDNNYLLFVRRGDYSLWGVRTN